MTSSGRTLALLLAMLLPLAVPTARAQAPLGNALDQIPRATSDMVNNVLRGTLDVPSRIPGGTNTLTLTPDGQVMAARLANGQVRAWHLETGAEIGFWPDAGAAAAELLPLGDEAVTLAARSDDGTVRLWQPGGGAARPLAVPVPVIALAARDGHLALAGRDGSLYLLEKGQDSPRPLGSLADVTALAWIGGDLLAGTSDGMLHRLAVTDGTQQGSLKLAAPARQLLRAGDGVIVLDDEGGLFIWESGVERPRRLDRLRSRPTALAVEPGRNLLVLVNGREIRALDLTSGKRRWTMTSPRPAQAAALHPSGRLLLADNEEIGIWAAEREARILRLIPAEDGWMAVDAAGRYDGTGLTTWQAGWQTQDGRLPVQRLQESNYEPELLGKSLQAAPEMLTAQPASIEQGIDSPPKVSMEFTSPPPALLPATLVVRITAEDQGDGLEAISLQFNQKPVPETARIDSQRPSPGKLVETWQVEALPGVNRLLASAAGRRDIHGISAELTASLSGHVPEPTLHILAVGVNDVKEITAIRADKLLRFPNVDAQSIAEQLSLSGAPLFTKVSPRLLYRAEEVTQEAILAALELLRTTKPEDVVVIFLAGHGISIGDHWYFLTGDTPLAPVRDQSSFLLDQRAISASRLIQLIQAIPAGRILVAIDSCHSGTVSARLKKDGELRAMARIGRQAGVHVVAATSPGEEAFEFQSLGHGAFTAALLEGMRQPSNTGSDAVRATELLKYTEQQTPLLIRKGALEDADYWRRTKGDTSPIIPRLLKLKPSTPTFFTTGEDFNLGRAAGVISAGDKNARSGG